MAIIKYITINLHLLYSLQASQNVTVIKEVEEADLLPVRFFFLQYAYVIYYICNISNMKPRIMMHKNTDVL